ncbi:hypothetical protein HY480_05105, partial [Candidatus Uhrbacteria bacterium]|nr:hypothetical protein [Candidatus Uhrbacteria bacterium]
MLRVLAVVTMGTGALVLLGWFTLPIRIALLITLLVCAAVRVLREGSPTRSFIIHHSSFIIPMVAVAIAAALILIASGTTEPIRSPWSVVPAPFFILFALGVAFAVQVGAISGIATTLLLSSLVAILVYPIGFGFDHFIHAAAERIIAMTGALSPRPLFYSGHYGLVVLLASALPGVPIGLVDRLLVPAVTTLLVVPFALHALRALLPARTAVLGTLAL